MQRRTLLAALGTGVAGLAGCTELGGLEATPTDRADDSPTDSPTDSHTPTPPGDSEQVQLPEGGIGQASIVDLETVPRTYALAPMRTYGDDGGDVRLKFAATATADHPARVVASLRNANDYANVFELRDLPPFGDPYSAIPHAPGERWASGDHTYRVGLALAPTANHDLVDDPPPVERGEDGQWRLGVDGGQWQPDRVRLDPGEVVRGEYAVVGRREGEGRGRPTGVYDFGGDEGFRIAVWNTDRPGPETESRFAGESVPPLRDGEDDGEVAWYHDADATAPSYVQPSTERARLPAEVEFTFVNHARESTQCGHWNVFKLHDGEWFHVGPWGHTADCRIVPPGGSKSWTLHAFHGPSVPCDGAHPFGFLGGGRYAAVAGYGHDTASSGAMVDLVADPLTVTATPDVETVRSDGTVAATSDRWGDGEEPPNATLTLARATNGAGEATRLIPEQVMRWRYRGLRNTLAFVGGDGVDRVVLHTDESVAENVVGYDAETRLFRFDGQDYRVTIDRKEE